MSLIVEDEMNTLADNRPARNLFQLFL